MKIQIKKLRDTAIIPEYHTAHAAAVDIAACLDAPVTLESLGRAVIPTGFAIALPVGYEAQIRPRSGMAAKHGIALANGVATIDADYRGEIGVILINLSKETFIVEPGMRIAQMIIAKHETAQWDVVEELDETERGKGAYGSTGK